MAFGISGLALFIIALLLKQHRGRRWVLALSLFLYARYLIWRLLYTIPTDDSISLTVGIITYLAELYGLVQSCFFTYQAWLPTERKPAPITTYPTVDIMVTVVNEPLPILRQTLIGCLAQDYPKDRFKVYVLDDGHRLESMELATALGCEYLARQDGLQHAKAGNLNHALGHSTGDLVAVFDVDQVPTRTFLKDTVGFFDDPSVALVQTPHHFYNPDIFQRNLRLDDKLHHEQALFFRTLQAGRDSHNSAFFAGSGGLFRRKPLMEIGGFQTQTLTEDLHTSIQLHARGYKSYYLNNVLSAGLMPETFEGYLKQRKRWAMGSIQVMLHDNPLTKRGLTLPQRIDYFGSIYYFFFGLPRVICLIAPLSSLLFGVSPLRTDVWTLTIYLSSFFIASALSIRPVTQGTRNVFWSDVYETAMCFSLSLVALKVIVAPRKERKFEVTPKGEQVSKSTASELSLAWPHLVTFGLLVFGLTLGAYNLWLGNGNSGLLVNLFWGSINLLLLTLAIFVASERSQGRRAFRLKRDYLAKLIVDGQPILAQVTNINEQGAAVELDRPIFTAQKTVALSIMSSTGSILRLTGRIIRQTSLSHGRVEAGLQFADLDDATRRELVEKIFGDRIPWEETYLFKPGLMSSLRSIGLALRAPWRALVRNRRQTIRVPVQIACQLLTAAAPLKGIVRDISFTGLCVEFRDTPKGSLAGSLLELTQVTLKVNPVAIIRRGTATMVQFCVENIERGEEHWREWHHASWQIRLADGESPYIR